MRDFGNESSQFSRSPMTTSTQSFEEVWTLLTKDNKNVGSDYSNADAKEWLTRTMPFGKHMGLTFEEIAKKDIRYLFFVRDNLRCDNINEFLRSFLVPENKEAMSWIEDQVPEFRVFISKKETKSIKEMVESLNADWIKRCIRFAKKNDRMIEELVLAYIKERVKKAHQENKLQVEPDPPARKRKATTSSESKDQKKAATEDQKK